MYVKLIKIMLRGGARGREYNTHTPPAMSLHTSIRDQPNFIATSLRLEPYEKEPAHGRASNFTHAGTS
jgi:hypothetical protein